MKCTSMDMTKMGIRENNVEFESFNIDKDSFLLILCTDIIASLCQGESTATQP